MDGTVAKVDIATPGNGTDELSTNALEGIRDEIIRPRSARSRERASTSPETRGLGGRQGSAQRPTAADIRFVSRSPSC